MNNVKHTVLVIEDEQYISKVLETLLSADGYRVITAQTGAAARAHVFAYMPDVVLLDLGLPDVDGIQLLREMRERIHIPVIVVSARNMEKDKVAALDNGADDYITKPFSAPELLARMRAVLRRHTVAEVQEDFYAVGDFRIDFSKRVVTVGGEAVRLTQVEYRIVELIARQPGKVLTYSHIINHIWGPYADNENNRILRVNMSNIRRKIEQDRLAPKYILTEIGVGYRMAEKV